MCEARYQRPNSKNAKFINMQHIPSPSRFQHPKRSGVKKAPTTPPAPPTSPHLTSPHIAPLWEKNIINNSHSIRNPQHNNGHSHLPAPLSLPTPSKSVHPASPQARLRAPVRPRADGRDLALDGFARELLPEGCVDEVEREPAREHLPDVEGAGVVGGEGRDELGVCAAWCFVLMC